jgi:hypothetical protein
VITGSALPRLLNCPASEVLESAETHSEAAAIGSDDHEELAHQVRTSTLPPELARHVPLNPRAEVKLAYDVATHAGRFLGEAANRNYGVPGPFEIFMSTDVVGVEGDTVVVLDWKTGGDVEPAMTNGQLWGCALAACRALGKHKAVVRIVYTNQRARCDEYEIDALDLAEFAGRLEHLHLRVADLRARKARGEILDTREGPWCKYCSSKHVCPSKVGLLVQVAEKGLAVIGDTAMTGTRARAAYEQVVLVEQLVRDARKRLETYVDENGPIDLGGGRVFGRYVRNGNERLSGDIAVQAIAEIVGESAREFEAIAIERKTGKAAIDRACKTLGTPRGTAPAIIRRIRELGGATHAADTMPVGEFMLDRDEPAERPAIDVAAVNSALEGA